MKRLLLTLLLIGLLAGCGHHLPALVSAVQIGDDYRNCEQIKLEIEDNQDKILKRYPHEDKRAQNLALGIGGYFLMLPWLLIDIYNTEAHEIDAFLARNTSLRHLANAKQCDISRMPAELPFLGLQGDGHLHAKHHYF